MYVDFEEKNLRQRLRYRPGKGILSNFSDTIYNASVGRDVQFVRETEHLAVLQTGFEQKKQHWDLDAGAFGA